MPRVTIEQKIQLRDWFNKQKPKPSQSEAIAWFKRQFKETLPQYQISRILNTKNLDKVTLNSPGIQNTRISKPEWPVLEQILKRWQIGMEIRGISTSKEVFMQKAREIWLQYPEARNNLMPDLVPIFGTTWCALFQKRHGIQSSVFRGERTSADVVVNPPETKAKMAALCKLVAETPIGNRYNMDQTGLYWRRSASKRAGRKSDKTRISIGLTTNDTGDDRFEAWFVGKAEQPRALKNFNWKGHKAVWRHNSKAWFTTSIMNEWLEAFYSHIQATKPDQKVLLLLDNFSAHISGLKETPPPPNITVEFFPSNVTSGSIYQPMEMGIISVLKTYYRRSFLLWMCQNASVNTWEDPVRLMNVRLAIVWICKHFYNTLESEAIQKCWVKSTLLGQGGGNIARVQDPPTDLTSIYWKATAHTSNRVAMASFLNPPDENRPPDDPTTDLEVLEDVLGDWTLSNDYRDPEEVAEEAQQPEIVPITLQEGLNSLNSLMTLAESNEAFSHTDIRSIQQLKGVITRSMQEEDGRQESLDRIQENGRQESLDKWLQLE